MDHRLDAEDRVAVPSSDWHLSELVRHLENVAQAKGLDVDIPDPLFFVDLLRILSQLGIKPAKFFHGVVERWQRDRPDAGETPALPAEDELRARQGTSR